ncbi:hypothetical protein BD324DRAFT_651636 [Kockovaella imperatae]|uniref:Uncharacterized protein n=1 Tax=Kockovaella imperatae TaxID=4999 RepID=A0A1Y1UFW0_9TREE|nr:hypothetical protein BD324DRAFT_651636 [Kockovaella imperatae]ORX36396.1 hypothetical protein BD324DRAFT_651636 [Kockovaella imperatae]
MSLVLSPPPPPRSPHHVSLSRSSSPCTSAPGSRPCTPPPLSPAGHTNLPMTFGAHTTSHGLVSSSPGLTSNNPTEPLSAPSTPVTTKHTAQHIEHAVGMERCRSSEPTYHHPIFSLARQGTDDRSRGREPKATALRSGRVISHGSSGIKKRDVETNSLPTSPSALRDSYIPLPGEAPSGQAKDLQHLKDQDVPDIGPILGPSSMDESMDIDEPPLQNGQGDDVSVVDRSLDDIASAEGTAPVDAEEDSSRVWGMPKWGVEDREQVRPGVRILHVDELPPLMDQHAMVDTPSHVLFPWLHGISDDGKRGQSMAAFFGLYPPFEPPRYRGLSVLFASGRVLQKCTPEKSPSPPRKSDVSLPSGSRPSALSSSVPTTASEISSQSAHSRGRSETTSTSTESYASSSGTTEATSPSIGDIKELASSAPNGSSSNWMPITEEPTHDVEMHPCEPKRSLSVAAEKDKEQSSSLPRDDITPAVIVESGSEADGASFEEVDSWGQDVPNSLLLNSLFVDEIFEGIGETSNGELLPPRFCSPNLPRNINLRNLNIQPIKYATISDLVLYARNGCSEALLNLAERVAAAQDNLYHERMEEYYQHVDKGQGEGINRPVKYGVWIVNEPFHVLEKIAPQLVNVTSQGESAPHPFFMDVFDRENCESRIMTRATEVVEGLWVGNEADVPGNQLPGDVGPQVRYNLCIRAWELGNIPSANDLKKAHEKILEMDQDFVEETSPRRSEFNPTPATVALRNLLSPNSSQSTLPEQGGSASLKRAAATDMREGERNGRNGAKQARYVSMTVAGCSRSTSVHGARPREMVDRLVAMVYWLRKLIERRDGTNPRRARNVLVYCQDGYTENSMLVLAYIMSSLSISLPEAYLHLQNTAQRSFFLFGGDKPLLRKVDERLTADRKAKALKILQTSTEKHHSSSSSPLDNLPSPTSGGRWKNWGLTFGKSEATTASSSPDGSRATRSKDPKRREDEESKHLVEMAKKMLEEEEQGGRQSAKDARVWFDDRRFDGFPSRILPFLYLGNLEHAGNAAMLSALSITHVVSVGESLINCAADTDPMYGQIGENTLSAAYRDGKIQVLDLNDVRDDGNDPLRPIIARACEWIEAARLTGGKILVHCRVGVSRSASIVMAYMMQYHRLGLMDAYLVTRARRLNVLIQPNLRFYHELFGWEIELAKRELDDPSCAFTSIPSSYGERSNAPMSLPVIVGRRNILYCWPSFCRELYYLNRRFLCN